MSKILFINPVIREEDDPKHVPYGMAMLAAIASNDGHLVQIYDANAWRLDDDALKEAILADKWDVIATDPVNSLDVSILQNRILDSILGINNPRTDNRIDFIGGIRGTKELERKVIEKDAAVAFSMYPVDVSQLMDIADSGEMMPPKSTWFEPKLRSGLFIHTF